MHVLRKTIRPIIQILLIPELSVLLSRKAPLNAAVLPPFANQFTSRPRKCHELNAVSATSRRLVVLRCIRVFGDEDLFARVLELPENRRRVMTKPNVRIDIGNAINLRISFKDETWCERGKGPTVFDSRTFLFDPQKCWSLHG